MSVRIGRVADGSVIAVRLQPRSARDEVVGEHGGALRVRVTAPPVGGRANEALIRILAGALGLPRGALAITAGHRGRTKSIQVAGLAPADIRQRLGLDVGEGKGPPELAADG